MNSRTGKWLGLEITVDSEAVEAIEFALNLLDAHGTAISFRRAITGEVLTVTGYFEEPPDDEKLRDELDYALRSYEFDEKVVHSVSWTKVENADWLAEWKKHWKPTTIGRFVITPPWEMVDDPEKIIIKIEPNMAFGTGTHETTQLCISAIEKLYYPGDSFLDVGTGTGILAIAAAKISATYNTGSFENPNAGDTHSNNDGINVSVPFVLKILACDIDADSVKIARENAELNGVGSIHFAESQIMQEMPQFDFVCANLTIDVILPTLPLLLEKTKRTLVLSGILAEQKLMILDVFGNMKIRDFMINELGEWISVTISIC